MKYVEDFFAFARLREEVRLAKASGQNPPYTTDPILQKYRFCNIFREDDRTTIWIAENIREPLRDKPTVLMALALCRFINRIESLGRIKSSLLSPRLNDVSNWNGLRNAITINLMGVNPIITGAYMVKTPKGLDKLDGIMTILEPLQKDAHHLMGRMEADRGELSLQGVHEVLCEYPYIGNFMAYEIVTDLRHTDYLCEATDILTWACPGPGAARGASRVLNGNCEFLKYGSKRDEGLLLVIMRELLEESRRGYRWPWQDKPWEMREVEHTLCEFDKYERARLGEGKPKQMYTPHGA